MKFSEKLQKLRKENNLSQEQLADMLEVSRQSVSKWESGQTYPEMDKLITMCKIFKCSLDDLTNDEITDVNISNKQKNNFTNIIDEMLDIINRTFSMFKKMNSKDIAHFIVEMVIIVLLLIIFKTPFNYLYYLVRDIFNNFPTTIGNILSSVLNLILTISYFILCVIIFVYIYKIRYLDKYDKISEKEEIDTSENDDTILEQKNKNEESIKVKKEKKEHSFVIFKVLGNLVMYFIKFMAFCMGIPFIFSLVFLFAGFIASIILLFKGVFFIGILLGIISLILLNILVIELIFNFLFNKKAKIKRTFITLIVSLAGIGIASGITVFDIANITYIDEVPEKATQKIITKEIEMTDDLIIDNNYWKNIKYIEDNNLDNKIVIESKYYDKYLEVDIVKNTNFIYINTNNVDKIVGSDILNNFISDLSNKEIHNYNKLYEADITVKATAENIEKLKNNYDNYYSEISSIEDSYNDQLESYINEINEKDNKIYDLESENYQLKEEIEEYKYKIQEYKDNMNSLINE